MLNKERITRDKRVVISRKGPSEVPQVVEEELAELDENSNRMKISLPRAVKSHYREGSYEHIGERPDIFHLPPAICPMPLVIGLTLRFAFPLRLLSVS